MTVTITVGNEVWFQGTGVTHLSFIKGLDNYLVLYDKEGKEHSVKMEEVTGFVVTDS